MKVLLISKYFEPQNTPRAFRTTELAFELHRQGHEVTVMAPEIYGMKPSAQYPFQIKSIGKLSWTETSLSANGLELLFRRAVRRGLKLLFEYPDLELFFKVRKYLQTESSYDLLISIAVPHSIHWGVGAVQGKKHKVANTWVADCGDPFMGAENDTFSPPFYFGWIERWFMRRADFITVPVESAIQAYYPEFHSKFKVIPQGFNFDEVKTHPIINDGTVRFGYGGAFIQGRRDPSEFMTFLTGLPLAYNFEFHVYTSQSQFVDSFMERDSRIVLHSPVTRLELLEELSKFQFVVNFTNRGAAQVPSKLIDYAIINKPVLQVETGNLEEKVVLEFLNGVYTSGLTIYDPDQYRIENVAQQMMNLVDG